jgi:hypothetical protein
VDGSSSARGLSTGAEFSTKLPDYELFCKAVEVKILRCSESSKEGHLGPSRYQLEFVGRWRGGVSRKQAALEFARDSAGSRAGYDCLRL